MTLEAIRVAVTASGVPEGSTEFEAQVAATRCALIPPPTSTPMPWRLTPEQPYLVSANCLGSELPGQGVRLWQDGVWVEANQYAFADPAELEAPRHSYLAYLDLMSFAAAPPGDDFEAKLAEYMMTDGVLPSPESCFAGEVSSQVLELARQDLYVRLTFKQSIEWNAAYYLYVSPVDIQLALPWSTGPVLQELLSMESNTPLRHEFLAGLAGTARFRYDPATSRWYLTDDEGGYYCHVLPLFLN
ncbi:MAG: hypothetical protein IT318_21785 [Anaerolineales bacterium]|nr:hypothetical protein [Anaerolineales bacterium]